MSRASMAAALSGPDKSLLFGIGSYRTGGRQVDFEIGWPEYERDVRWSHRVLATWDIQVGDHVLLTTPNFEGPWASPIVRALRALGTVHSNAEPYSWDGRRSATFLKLLPVKAVIGMSAQTATALIDLEAVELLSSVRLLWARPEAVGVLRAEGLAPAVFAMLGPAVALECPQRAGAHIDPDEWQIEFVRGGLVLNTVGARAHGAHDLSLDVTGDVDDSPCPCGLPGSRIRLDPS